MWSFRVALLIAISGLLLAVLVLPADASPAPGNYRSAQNYLTLDKPAGWGVAEGGFSLAKELEGRIGLNSWGQDGFWPSPGIMGPYNSDSIIERIPPGGAYVGLARIWSPVATQPPDVREYTSSDLGALLSVHDWRNDSPSAVKRIYFYRWGRPFELDIFCSPSASDQVVDQLNLVLSSWRFDAIPVGDAEWASLKARPLLPKSIAPDQFPIRPGSIFFLRLVWTTEAETDGETVHLRFVYGWAGKGPPYPIPENYAFPSSHWWRIDVLSTGQAKLVSEGGSRFIPVTILPQTRPWWVQIPRFVWGLMDDLVHGRLW